MCNSFSAIASNIAGPAGPLSKKNSGSWKFSIAQMQYSPFCGIESPQSPAFYCRTSYAHCQSCKMFLLRSSFRVERVVKKMLCLILIKNYGLWMLPCLSVKLAKNGFGMCVFRPMDAWLTFVGPARGAGSPTMV